MNQFARSWALTKASFEVLKKDKELMIFPIISSVALMVVSASFFIPMALGNLFDSVALKGFPVAGYVVLFGFYVVQYLVMNFANTALVGAAGIRLRGGDPTVGDGFRIAMSHFWPILGYSLIAGTVGMLLKMFSEKSKGWGRFIISLLGAGWNVLTFLVVPVLANEDVGPIEAIKRSWDLLKRSWGEQIIGNTGIGLVFGLGIFALIVVMVGGGAGLSILLESWIPAVFFGVGLIVLLTFAGFLQSTLKGIYSAAVYAYAVNGQVVFFEEDQITSAFLPRR
ncbi:MAG: hypothetical protein JW750_03585 [Anaerolineaceae bacterium]|nr:hypothetical protein [Anaerolineaceae bacterium]